MLNRNHFSLVNMSHLLLPYHEPYQTRETLTVKVEHYDDGDRTGIFGNVEYEMEDAKSILITGFESDKITKDDIWCCEAFDGYSVNYDFGV